MQLKYDLNAANFWRISL